MSFKKEKSHAFSAMRTYIAKVDNFRAKSNQYVWIVSRCYVDQQIGPTLSS